MYHNTASGLASLGRGGDDTLVHMNKGEVAALNALNYAANNRPLTVNPQTGLPEAMDLTEILMGLGMAAATIATAGAALPALGPVAGTLLTTGVGAGLGAAKNAATGKDPGTGAAFGAASGLTAGVTAGLGGAAEGAAEAGTQATEKTAEEAAKLAAEKTAEQTAKSAVENTAGQGVTGAAGAPEGGLTFLSSPKDVGVMQSPVLDAAKTASPVEKAMADTSGLEAITKPDLVASGQGMTGPAGTPAENMTFLSSPKDVGVMQSPVLNATKTAAPIEKVVAAEPSMLDNAIKPFKDMAADPFSDKNKAAFAVGTGLMGLEDSMNQQAQMQHQDAQQAEALVNQYKAAGVDVSTALPPSLLAAARKPKHFAVGGSIRDVQGLESISPSAINQQPMSDFYPQSMIPQAQPLQRSMPIRHEVLGYADGGPIGYGFAEGGNIGGGDEGLLHGPGTGQSDGIMGLIQGEQGQEPVRLAEGEFVIPADVVSALGDGSTKAGASVLYEMLDRIRQQAHGHIQQSNPVNPAKVLPV